MAGVFAQTLPESGTAIQPQAPVQSVDFGVLAAGINNAFGAFNTKENRTQKERDNELLRDFARDQTRLFKQRKQLGLRYRTNVKDSFNKFIEQNPAYADEASKLINSVHNIDVGAEFDPAVLQSRNMLKFATEDPVGQRILSRSITFVDGAYDPEATMDKFTKLYHEEMGAAFEMAEKRRQLEDTEMDVKEREIVRNEAGQRLLQKQLREVNDNIDVFLQNMDKTGIDLTGAGGIDNALELVNREIVRFRQVFAAEADASGISSSYDVEKALAPLIGMKEFLENNREEITRSETALTSENRVKLGKWVQLRTGLPQLGKDPEFFKYLDNTAVRMILSDEASVDEMFEWFKSEAANIDADEVFSPDVDLFDNPLADPTPNVVDPETGEETTVPDNKPFEVGDIFSEPLVEEVNKTTRLQRLQFLGTIKKTLESADLTLVPSDPNYRNLVAADLTKMLAFAFVNENIGVTSPNVIEAHLTPKVIRTYQALVKADPVLGARLQKSLAFVFNNNIETRASMLESRIGSIQQARGLRWKLSENNRVELFYDPNDPTLGTLTKKYLTAAQSRGYDTTVSSLVKFDKALRGENVELWMKARTGLHVDMNNELEKINRVNSVFRQKFPEIGNSPQWNKSLSSRFTSETPRVAPVIDGSRLNSTDDILKLGPGTYNIDWGSETSKVIVTDDGRVIRAQTNDE